MPGAAAYGAQAGAYPGAQAYPGAMQGFPGAAAPQNSYGGAQKALSGASTMLKVMRIVFIGIGALCIVGGVVLALTVELVSGLSTAFTGVVLIAVAFLVLPKFFGMMGQATAMVDGLAAKERLAQTGVPANGRLLQVQQTGRLVNYNPEIQALVEVQHPQFGTYQVQTTAVVPQIAIPRAQPGAPVQVRVDPMNKNEIALVF
jgi:hypothetical protein